MIVIISVSILAIILTYLEANSRLKSGMKIGFILLTIVASIQFCVGNDYITYYKNFLEVKDSSYSLAEIIEGRAHRDIGWGILIWLFSHVKNGFFLLVALLATLENLIYYRFISKYVDKRWWAFSVFLYTICTSMYLMNFTMLRQALVDAIFLACWPLIISKKWVPTLFILYLCTFIHGSSKVLLPFVFWGFIPFKSTKFWGIAYAVSLMALYLFGGFVNDILEPFFEMEDFKGYVATYGNDNRKISFGGIGFWIYLTPVILTVCYLITNKTSDKSTKSLVCISAIGSLILPFGTVIPMIGRLANYFVAYRLSAYPTIYQSAQNTILREVLLWLIILITIYDYYIFFEDPTWVAFTEFRTIFEVI